MKKCPYQNIEFANAEAVPMDQWRWPNFTPHELRSKGDGKVRIDPDAMDKLQKLRDILGRPILLTSAYRSKSHNENVGGAKYSLHLRAKAYDIRTQHHGALHLASCAEKAGFGCSRNYPDKGFMHVDTGKQRKW